MKLECVYTWQVLHSKVETEHERKLTGVSLSGLMIGKVCCMDEKVDNKICDIHTTEYIT